MKTCPKFEKCPIFTGNSASSENLEEIYRNLYCKEGEQKYTTCLRYIVAEKTGAAPPNNIFPNSSFSVEEVIILMKKQGIIKE